MTTTATLQTISAVELDRLLDAAAVPAGTVVATIDVGGYQSDPGVYVLTESLRHYTAAVMAIAEAVGSGAAGEAVQLLVGARGGAFGGAREMWAHLTGWTLDGPLDTGEDEDDEPVTFSGVELLHAVASADLAAADI